LTILVASTAKRLKLISLAACSMFLAVNALVVSVKAEFDCGPSSHWLEFDSRGKHCGATAHFDSRLFR
jgi:hypothetical protein